MKSTPQIIPPQPSTYAAFPESTISTDGMKVILADHSGRSCLIHTSVEYAYKSNMHLHLHIIEPKQDEDENLLFPLILFIQGSAWFEQNIGNELAQLSHFARRGFVIAIVEYRPSTTAPFPAQIKDTKSALRFMKKNAAIYHANPESIVLWGDSSVGHTAVMTGVSLEIETMDDESPTSAPISVKAVIAYYGPTDISKMCEEPSTMDHIGPNSPEGMLIGGVNVLENLEKVAPTVPMNYLSKDKKIPPILILHGNKDRLVPFGQSVLLFEALKQANKVVKFYQVKGADHGGYPFWAENVLNIVESFIRTYI